MDAQLGTEGRPLRVAIIGAGPAGFYAAEALLKQPNIVVLIDMFNRFPTPYGLVRERCRTRPSVDQVGNAHL